MNVVAVGVVKQIRPVDRYDVAVGCEELIRVNVFAVGVRV